jgi:hypothetical protein
MPDTPTPHPAVPGDNGEFGESKNPRWMELTRAEIGVFATATTPKGLNRVHLCGRGHGHGYVGCSLSRRQIVDHISS